MAKLFCISLDYDGCLSEDPVRVVADLRNSKMVEAKDILSQNPKLFEKIKLLVSEGGSNVLLMSGSNRQDLSTEVNNGIGMSSVISPEVFSFSFLTIPELAKKLGVQHDTTLLADFSLEEFSPAGNALTQGVNVYIKGSFALKRFTPDDFEKLRSLLEESAVNGQRQSKCLLSKIQEIQSATATDSFYTELLFSRREVEFLKQLLNDKNQVDLSKTLLSDSWLVSDFGAEAKTEAERASHERKRSQREKILEQQAVVPISRDEGKVFLTYTQMQKLATDHPNDEITYYFYDDRDDILDALHYFYFQYPNMIPHNVTLQLSKHVTRTLTEEVKQNILFRSFPFENFTVENRQTMITLLEKDPKSCEILGESLYSKLKLVADEDKGSTFSPTEVDSLARFLNNKDQDLREKLSLSQKRIPKAERVSNKTALLQPALDQTTEEVLEEKVEIHGVGIINTKYAVTLRHAANRFPSSSDNKLPKLRYGNGVSERYVGELKNLAVDQSAHFSFVSYLRKVEGEQAHPVSDLVSWIGSACVVTSDDSATEKEFKERVSIHCDELTHALIHGLTGDFTPELESLKGAGKTLKNLSEYNYLLALRKIMGMSIKEESAQQQREIELCQYCDRVTASISSSGISTTKQANEIREKFLTGVMQAGLSKERYEKQVLKIQKAMEVYKSRRQIREDVSHMLGHINTLRDLERKLVLKEDSVVGKIYRELTEISKAIKGLKSSASVNWLDPDSLAGTLSWLLRRLEDHRSNFADKVCEEEHMTLYKTICTECWELLQQMREELPKTQEYLVTEEENGFLTVLKLPSVLDVGLFSGSRCVTSTSDVPESSQPPPHLP